MGCYFLLQGIFSTQRSNPCLLHWLVDSLPLSQQGSLISRVLGYQSAHFTEGLISPVKETSWSFKSILTVFLLFKISLEGIFKSPSELEVISSPHSPLCLTSFPKEDPNGQQGREMMLAVISPERTVSHNRRETPSTPHQDGEDQQGP